MTTTIDTLVPEQLWQVIQPLLPTPPPRSGGRPRIDDRAALAGIVYQLRTGVPWRPLPTRELGCGSPITCWRRLLRFGEAQPAIVGGASSRAVDEARDGRRKENLSGGKRWATRRRSFSMAPGGLCVRGGRAPVCWDRHRRAGVAFRAAR